MKKIILLISMLSLSALTYAQTKGLKGDGQVFWEEHFDWADADSPRGWALPDGWSIEDNSLDDTGYVWVWTKDSMQGPFAHRDGGYILNSTTSANGFLAIDLDYLNAYISYSDMLYVNSSITLPVLDCSEHSSVIISLEQMFKYFNSPKMAIDVSNDNGAHWAEFDLKMGTSSATNTQNLTNDEVAYYSANLSGVAAGQAEVTIRITWDGSILYFWMLDDIVLREGWSYDLKMDYKQVQLIDENSEDAAGFYYMMPKSQIIPMGEFEGSVINYGDTELSNILFNVAINKNGVEQYNASSELIPYMEFGDPVDTLIINETYTPLDYGHYEIICSMQADEEEQSPDNNVESYFFHVTDSVFARTPDVSEANESPWRDYYFFTHEGDYMGVEYDPITDCEASSISVYIARSNMNTDFRVALLKIEPADENQLEMVELIYSEMIFVDSTNLGKWVTLPLELDGTGEFMTAGSRYIAAVQFWTYIEESDLANRGDTFWIGSTESYPDSYDKQWWYSAYNGEWTQGSNYNKMIRLNINNHENIIDGEHVINSFNSLAQNYPNPFSSVTIIDYELAKSEFVSIEIKDLTGRTVRVIDVGYKTAGKQSVNIKKLDLTAGLYFYKLKAGESTITKRMMVAD